MQQLTKSEISRFEQARRVLGHQATLRDEDIPEQGMSFRDLILALLRVWDETEPVCESFPPTLPEVVLDHWVTLGNEPTQYVPMRDLTVLQTVRGLRGIRHATEHVWLSLTDKGFDAQVTDVEPEEDNGYNSAAVARLREFLANPSPVV